MSELKLVTKYHDEAIDKNKGTRAAPYRPSTLQLTIKSKRRRWETECNIHQGGSRVARTPEHDGLKRLHKVYKYF